MPRKQTKPKVKYVQVKNPDQSAVDAVFNYLFDKVLEQQASKKNKSSE